MKKVTNLSELVDRSIRIDNSVVVYWSQFNEEEIVNITKYLQEDKAFCKETSAVAFVYNNCFYVTRYTRSVMSVLETEGFKKTYMYVPFSNGSCPSFELCAEWEHVCKHADEEWSDDDTLF